MNTKKINSIVKQEAYRIKCWKIINEQVEKFPAKKIKELIKVYDENQKQMQEYQKMISPILEKIDELQTEQNSISAFVQQKMEEYNKNEIKVSGYIAKISKSIDKIAGRGSYKDSFEKALTFLNSETQKLLKEFFNSTKQIKEIESKIFNLEKIEDQLNENIFDNSIVRAIVNKVNKLLDFVKSFFEKLLSKFDNTIKAQNDFNEQVKFLTSSKLNFLMIPSSFTHNE